MEQLTEVELFVIEQRAKGKTWGFILNRFRFKYDRWDLSLVKLRTIERYAYKKKAARLDNALVFLDDMTKDHDEGHLCKLCETRRILKGEAVCVTNGEQYD